MVTPALEKVVEANTLISGLGFDSGGLVAAHAIQNGLPAAPQAHGLAHGQKVNIGSVTQFVLEGAPTSEVEDFVGFTIRVGLPTTLTEIGLSPDDTDEIGAVARAATVESETIHSMPFPVRADDVAAALTSIERLARRIRERAGPPAPQPYRPAHQSLRSAGGDEPGGGSTFTLFPLPGTSPSAELRGARVRRALLSMDEPADHSSGLVPQKTGTVRQRA